MPLLPPPRVTPSTTSTMLVTWGWIALLPLPPAAFIIGLMLEGKSKASPWLVLLSIGWAVVTGIWLYSELRPPTPYGD